MSSCRLTKETAIKHKLITDECSPRPGDDQPESDHDFSSSTSHLESTCIGLSLMDATYKTTQCVLPLFFISVSTNTGHCIV